MEKKRKVKTLIILPESKISGRFLNSEYPFFVEVWSARLRGKLEFREGKNQDKS